MTTKEKIENIEFAAHTPTGFMFTQILPIPVVQRETTEEKNKRLHEILGLHWHELERKTECSCGVQDDSLDRMLNHIKESNLNFYTDAGTVQLLRELEKWEHGRLFFALMFYDEGVIDENDDDGMIYRTLVTTPGLLADKVIEWRKQI